VGVTGRGMLLEAVGSCFGLVLLDFLFAMMKRENAQVADDAEFGLTFGAGVHG